MDDREWWHGSREPLTDVRRFLHVGSLEQATMRAGEGCHLVRVSLSRGRSVRRRDRGTWRTSDLTKAMHAGVALVTYLNRYEGIPLEEVEAARAACPHLDDLPDARFRRLVPSSTDSVIVLDPSLVRIVETRSPTGRRTA